MRESPLVVIYGSINNNELVRYGYLLRTGQTVLLKFDSEKFRCFIAPFFLIYKVILTKDSYF